MSLCHLLTGREQLDPGLSARLFSSFRRHIPNFDGELQALGEYVDANALTAQSVQQSVYGQEARSWTFGDVQVLLNRITRK